MATETPATPIVKADARHVRQEVTGVVTSAKMEKTIIVKVTRLVQHKLYRRVIRVSKKFYAHDEERKARAGDTVELRNPRGAERIEVVSIAYPGK